jgi:hypothetical protein
VPDADSSLTNLLDRLDRAAQGTQISVSDVVDELGDRAIIPLILLIALIMLSPLSGVLGMPTLAAILIITLAVQALFGRRRLWLPHWIKRLNMRASRMRTVVDWLRKPSAFLDRHSRPRLRVLTHSPLRWLTLLFCVVVPAFWPLLEVLPFVTTLGALIVSLLAFGLLTRDGIYVLAGYCIVLCVIAALFLVF